MLSKDCVPLGSARCVLTAGLRVKGVCCDRRLVTLASGAAAGKFLRYEAVAPSVAAQTAYGIECEVPTPLPKPATGSSRLAGAGQVADATGTSLQAQD